MADTNGTTTYEYDAMQRLMGVTYPNDDEQAYPYDAVGNRLTKDENESTIEYEYDAADQLLSVDAVSYDYDANGNQIERGNDTFEWDYENRLTDSTIDSVSASYDYNGDGLRISQTVGMNSVLYVWDLAAPMPSILQDSAGYTYVYGLDLISRTDGEGNQEYYLSDGLGSTTGITDDAGDATDEYEYDAFGAVRSHIGSSTNEFQFTGEQTDSSGLEYLRVRYYDQETGRFLGRDPVQYLQRYSYVFNNPVNLTDPSGMDPSLQARLGEAIQAGGNCVEAYATASLLEMITACGELLGQITELSLALQLAAIEGAPDAWDWAVDRTEDLLWAYKDTVDWFGNRWKESTIQTINDWQNLSDSLGPSWDRLVELWNQVVDIYDYLVIQPLADYGEWLLTRSPDCYFVGVPFVIASVAFIADPATAPVTVPIILMLGQPFAESCLA